MTHNVKLISERTDGRFSILYLLERRIFSFYRQTNIEYFKENDIYFFICFTFLILCYMIQGIRLMSSKLC